MAIYAKLCARRQKGKKLKTGGPNFLKEGTLAERKKRKTLLSVPANIQGYL